MIPRLYPAGTTVFSNEGLGALSDCIRAVATTAINGVPELTITYPVTGVHASEIDERCIIIADRDQHQGAQPYIVQTVDKSMIGRMEIHAVHLAMDLLEGVAVEAYTATSLTDALTKIFTYKTDNLDVTVTSDFASNKAFTHSVPSSVKSLMGGMDGSVIDTYGGEWDLVNLTATLKSRIGADNGVVIRYGKNLQSLKMETDWSTVYTGIYPFWVNFDNGTVRQMTPPVYSLGTFPFTRTLMLDASGEFMDSPTDADLLAYATDYEASHSLTSPKISWDVVMQDLRNSPEYKNLALLEQVAIGDTVGIYFPEFGITASARIVSEEYDVLRGKYNRLTIGSVRSSLAKAIAGQAQETKAAITHVQTAMAEAIQRATDAITGNVGGYIVTVLNASDEPQELLIMDTNDVTTAQKVWRWNLSGLGYSSTGYLGPYTTAITQDGEIVADFIKTGTLDASLINVINLIAQHVRATDGTKVMDIASASLKVNNGADWRAWLYTDANNQGSLMLYGGTRPNLNGDAQDAGNDSTSRMAWIDANGIAVGVDNSGTPTGSVRAGTIRAYTSLRSDGDIWSYGDTWSYGDIIQYGAGLYRGYNAQGKQIVTMWPDGGTIRLYDTSGKERFLAVNTGTIRTFDSNGKDILWIDDVPRTLNLKDGTYNRVVLSGSSGNIQSYMASGQEAIGLYPAESQISLYNSSGTRTVQIRGDGTASGSPLPVNQGGTGKTDNTLPYRSISSAPTDTSCGFFFRVTQAFTMAASSGSGTITIPNYTHGIFIASTDAVMIGYNNTFQLFVCYRNSGTWKGRIIN